MKSNFLIREAMSNDKANANAREDWLIAEHFYRMWLDNQVSPELIKTNYREVTLDFIKNARQKLYFKAYFAEIEGQIIGSISCQLFEGLYPLILSESYRKYGYIWGVYVEPEYRGQGIGKQLTQSSIAYLKSIDCTRVVLNASPSGKPVYSNLGFTESNGMWLDISGDR